MRPDWLEQARGVGVGTGGVRDGVGGIGEAVLIGVGIRVGAGRGVGVIDGVEELGTMRPVAVVVKVPVTMMGDVTVIWLDEQAASPMLINKLDAKNTTVFTAFLIS
jgi:hypothetical protein